MSALAWMTRAACADVPELPWLVESEHVTAFKAARMRSICSACPVRGACERYADDQHMTVGWWAGQDRGAFDVLAPATPAQGVLPLEFGAVGDAA